MEGAPEIPARTCSPLIYRIPNYTLGDMVEYAERECAKRMTKMKTNLTTKLPIALFVLLTASPVISVGCEGGQLPTSSSPGEFSPVLVPNTDLDVYIYAKQDSATTVPAWLVDAPGDIEVESLALWGVPAEDEFALGIGIALTSPGDASALHAEIDLEEDGWKMLSGSTIYFVQGSGTTAESLKTAISNHDFKYCDDSEFLEAAATLPSYGTTKPAAIALAKPSTELIGFIAKDADPERLEQINTMLKLADPKVIAVGLYSPHEIDVPEIVETMESDGSISDLNLGLLGLVKSGLPGFVVEPAIKKFLTESEFTEVNFGEFTLYKRSLHIDGGKAITVLVWIKGNRAFAAVAGQESYAEALISSMIASVNSSR